VNLLARPVVSSRCFASAFLVLSAAAFLAGCNGSYGGSQSVSVQTAPPSANVQTGQTQQFTATVYGAQNTAVTWQVNGVTGGNSTVGTISASGLYTAPSGVPNPATVTVTAISQADTTKSSSATVTVTPPPVTVSISPKNPSVQVSLTQQFTATVANTSNTAVTWQVNGVTGGNLATTGSISASGLYTTPAAVPSGTVTVKAISQADNTKSDSTTVTITAAPPPIIVTISPKNPTVQVSLTQQFTATVANTSNTAVTWQVNGVTGGNLATTGSISASGLYTAPAAVPSGTVTVKAISQADNTKSDSTTVTVTLSAPISVTISPVRGGLTIGQSMNFTASVTNDVGAAGVTWSTTSGTLSNQTTSAAKYTAPGSAGAVTVTATSVADGTKSASATLGVTDLAGVFTYHNDNSRTGANLKEFALTTATVTTASFGKLFSCSVDAAIYAQPLWVANLTIAGGTNNVLYVVTQHDTIYAFDADSSSCTNLWGGPISLLGASETWVSSGDTGCGDLTPDIGIVGTPVIDPATKTLYVVSKSKNGTTYHQRVHALDLATGAEKFSGPVEVTAMVNGIGDGSSGGHLTFDPLIHNQRSGLLFSNGHIIIVWAAHCDLGSYHGWVMSYGVNGSGALVQEAVLNVSPDHYATGIWMAGGAPAADSSGNIYLVTGNGFFDANSSGTSYGDSIVKLSPPSAGTFSVASYFTPSNQSTLDGGDIDLGSGGLVLLPDLPSGLHTQLLAQAGKDGRIFVADRSALGAFSSSSNNVVQEIDNAVPGGMWGSPAYWNGHIYFGAALDQGANSPPSDPLRDFSFNTTTGAVALASSSSKIFSFTGPTPSVSSNGTTGGTGIVWALDNVNWANSCPASCQAVYAYDATTLNTKLWDSTQAASNRDRSGGAVKFAVPTVANGKVYVGGQNSITVYGLLPN